MNSTITDLTEYVGKFVCLIVPNRLFFGVLQTDGTNYMVPPVPFSPDRVKEIRKIEADPSINEVRAVIAVQ
jgi:hypothetical protein